MPKYGNRKGPKTEVRRYPIIGAGGQKKGFLEITPEGRRLMKKKGIKLSEIIFRGKKVEGVSHINLVDFYKGSVIKQLVEPITFKHHTAEFGSILKQREVSKKVVVPLGRLVGENVYFSAVVELKGFKPSTQVIHNLSKEQRKLLFEEVKKEYKKLLDADLLPMDIRPPQILLKVSKSGKVDFRFIDTSILPTSKEMIWELFNQLGMKSLADSLEKYLERKGIYEYANTIYNLKERLQYINTEAINWYESLPLDIKHKLAEKYYEIKMEELAHLWKIK
ncbi:MAG: hypothetical protein N3D73_02140 [Candidatus Diapherotrites archaeon]|nr:hypothetical protein [Candidatus Diapherotrites archaeon]